MPVRKELPQTALEKKQAATPEVKASPQPGLPTILGVNVLWYVAVLFLGWIGGLIAWWKNKKQAPQASRYLLFGGIGWSAVQGVLAVILVAVLIITPALKAGFKWPFTAVKPASVTQESQWIEGDPTGKTGSQWHYVPPQVKRTETGTIFTDTPVELATTQIDTSGGTITVDKPGDPLNGLQLDRSRECLQRQPDIQGVVSTDHNEYLR